MVDLVIREGNGVCRASNNAEITSLAALHIYRDGSMDFSHFMISLND